jgi:hypothetical protein
LLRALLLQAFYSVRSEKQLVEQLDYNLLFRWFVGLSLDPGVWDETVFTKNRDRLIEGDIARKFMAAVLSQEPVKALLSDDHFSVDGTLIEAWASMKSFRPKDGSGEPPAAGRNGERDYCGHWNWSYGQCLVTGRILALCDPGGRNPVLGGAVAFAPYPTVVKSLIDRQSSPGALAFRLVSASAGCPVQ